MATNAETGIPQMLCQLPPCATRDGGNQSARKDCQQAGSGEMQQIYVYFSLRNTAAHVLHGKLYGGIEIASVEVLAFSSYKVDGVKKELVLTHQ